MDFTYLDRLGRILRTTPPGEHERITVVREPDYTDLRFDYLAFDVTRTDVLALIDTLCMNITEAQDDYQQSAVHFKAPRFRALRASAAAGSIGERLLTHLPSAFHSGPSVVCALGSDHGIVRYQRKLVMRSYTEARKDTGWLTVSGHLATNAGRIIDSTFGVASFYEWAWHLSGAEGRSAIMAAAADEVDAWALHLLVRLAALRGEPLSAEGVEYLPRLALPRSAWADVLANPRGSRAVDLLGNLSLHFKAA